mmetsp:Transcript_80252/g.227212  ORF Transcript_80252/g.227212 Transcript_80252/m.227212 type:complete len:278 (+) Transcript_80252:731-1564(+)
MVTLVHVLVVVAHCTLVRGLHQEVVGKASVLKVMHRGRQQAGHAHKGLAVARRGACAAEGGGRRPCHATKLHKGVHGVQHRGRVRAVMVEAAVVIPVLYFGQESTQLPSVQTEVLDQLQLVEQVYTKRAEWPVVGQSAELYRVKLPVIESSREQQLDLGPPRPVLLIQRGLYWRRRQEQLWLVPMRVPAVGARHALVDALQGYTLQHGTLLVFRPLAMQPEAEPPETLAGHPAGLAPAGAVGRRLVQGAAAGDRGGCLRGEDLKKLQVVRLEGGLLE